MRNYIIFLILFGFSFDCAAQKLKRHEITLGFYSGYFFDNSAFKLEWTGPNNRQWLPSFTYSYYLNEKIRLSAGYSDQYYAYILNGVNKDTKTNSMFLRRIKQRTISVSKRIFVNEKFRLLGSFGINYRTGTRIKFLYYLENSHHSLSVF